MPSSHGHQSGQGSHCQGLRLYFSASRPSKVRGTARDTGRTSLDFSGPCAALAHGASMQACPTHRSQPLMDGSSAAQPYHRTYCLGFVSGYTWRRQTQLRSRTGKLLLLQSALVDCHVHLSGSCGRLAAFCNPSGVKFARHTFVYCTCSGRLKLQPMARTFFRPQNQLENMSPAEPPDSSAVPSLALEDT